MLRLKIYTTAFIIIMLLGCKSKSKENIFNNNNDSIENIGFVIDKELSLNDYSDIKGITKKEGLIPNEKMAFEIAEIVLTQIYGKETIESEKPFSINLQNDIWIIEGSLDKYTKGGVAYIEIQKSDGKILKVIHGE